MKDYNPVTHAFCRNCPHYTPEGRYVFMLEVRNNAESGPGSYKDAMENRKCRHLKACYRVSQFQSGQVSLFE